MCFDQIIEKYIPSIYIVMNNKNEDAYNIVLENIVKLINIGWKNKKTFKFITTDNKGGFLI